MVANVPDNETQEQPCYTWSTWSNKWQANDIDQIAQQRRTEEDSESGERTVQE